ncbi:fatty acid-binding protein homolog 6-like [Aricia agestis]|uniref:fatty acid-binding protein homolog 6-like n=1 Tax=Aricia agestis TaxID=91739 RepID=UPI001C20A229|nr:fatty acid-binding protein homolog 6-like [Aricia agestis]
MEEFLGIDYVQVSSENFEEYLAFIGVGYIARKAASTLSPVNSLTKNEDGSYTFSFKSRLVNADITFRLDEEFEERKPDGTLVTSVVHFEDNKMIHYQTDAKGQTSKHVREFYPDKMIVTTTVAGFDKTATRQFQLAQ